jgi:hypothetical protein
MPANQSQRPKFYEEQYLGAADLTAAVDYSRIQQARHALGAHTWGIAIGLQLKETPQPGGSGVVNVHLLPGYARDGYGRPIVVLSPYKIPEEKFSAIKFDPTIDTDGKGRLIPIWLRYDESATQNPRPGFEVCETEDQRSRIQETFRIEIDEPGTVDRYSGVTIGVKSLTDAKTALTAFDTNAPLVYDEAIPQQTFPEPQARARWLIPIGYVRWLPVLNQPGHFVARDDSGAGGTEKDSDKIRRVRRYIGVVAEEIEAADGVIRLRDRGKDPSKISFQAPLAVTDPKNPPINDLVWVEGNLRVLGDARLCAGKLDFRDQQGKDLNAPLRIQRSEDATHGVSVLQATIGTEGPKNHRFAIGPLKITGTTETVDEKFVVLSNGNVGIGTSDPSHKLHINGAAGIRQNRLYLSGGDGWSSVTYNAYHDDANKSWVFPDASHKVMTIELDDHQGVPRFEVFSNEEAKDSGWRSRLKVSGDTGNVLMAYQGGNVGIGTTNPTHKFHVLAQEAVGLFESTTTTQAYLRITTSEGLNNRVEITNRQGGRLSLFTSGAGDAFNITRDGNVGIGTTNPSSLLDVSGSLNVVFGHSLLGWTSGPSDETLKRDIAPLKGALNKLFQLRGVQFYWKEPEKMGNLTGLQTGLVAQEVEKVFPEWVTVGPNGYKAITFRGFEALTIEAFRELKTEVETIKADSQKTVTLGQALMLEALRELKTEIEGCKDRLQKLETPRRVPTRKK